MTRIARLLLAVGLLLTISVPAVAFDDVPASNVFGSDIEWLADTGITRGCNPPANDRFCPDDPVTRGQMAAFLTRALALTPADDQGFTDTATSVFTRDIDALAAAGITRGCNPPTNNRFCPDDPVTRGQMAAFLHRALGSDAGVIHYTHAGDLHSFDIATRQHRVLQDLPMRQGAFFSPDGAVFTSNGLQAPDNADTRVVVSRMSDRSLVGEFLFGGVPVQDALGVLPSPNGERFASIVHSSPPGRTVLRVTDRTGSPLLVIDSYVVTVTGLAWTTTGELVFAAHNSETNNGVIAHMSDVTDFDSLEVVREFPATLASLPRELAVSPDGRRVAYPFAGGIHVGSITTDATDHREVVTAPRTLARPAFSPDGTRLAMVMLDGVLGRGHIHVVSVPAAGSTHITPDGPTRLPGPDQGGVWSSGEDTMLGWFDS